MKAIYPFIAITASVALPPALAFANDGPQHDDNVPNNTNRESPSAIRAEVFGNLGLLGRRSLEVEAWDLQVDDRLEPSLGAGVGLSLLLGKNFGIGGRFEVTRLAHAVKQDVYLVGGLGGLAGSDGGGLGGVGVAVSGPTFEDFVVLDFAAVPRIRVPIASSRAAVYLVIPVGVSFYGDSQTGLRYGGSAGLEAFLSRDLGFFSEVGYQARTRSSDNSSFGSAASRDNLSELSLRLGVAFSP